MQKLNRNIAKKTTDTSPEYRESNLWIIKGTPQFLWDTIWETNKTMLDVNVPLNRNVIKIITETESNGRPVVAPT